MKKTDNLYLPFFGTIMNFHMWLEQATHILCMQEVNWTYLAEVFLQTRTNLQKALKRILHCGKMQKPKKSIEYVLFYRLFILWSHVSYSFTYYGETGKQLKVRAGKHVIFQLMFKVKSSVKSSIRNHLLFFDPTLLFDDLNNLASG